MSLDATRWAWMQQVGMSSAKLVLLAIADRADENHRAYPGIDRLASDTELNCKTIRSAIAHLEKIGAVSVLRRPGCVPIYQLIGVVGREMYRKPKGTTTPTNIGTPTEIGTTTNIGTRPLPKSVGVPLPILVPEPTNEPISNLSLSLSPESVSRASSCPHLKIIDLYHEILPELPGIVVSRWGDSKDAKALATRWKEDKRHQSIGFWRRFFETVRTNQHWMGANDRGWTANLRWLVKRESFDKVIERMVNASEAA